MKFSHSFNSFSLSHRLFDTKIDCRIFLFQATHIVIFPARITRVPIFRESQNRESINFKYVCAPAKSEREKQKNSIKFRDNKFLSEISKLVPCCSIGNFCKGEFLGFAFISYVDILPLMNFS